MEIKNKEVTRIKWINLIIGICVGCVAMIAIYFAIQSHDQKQINNIPNIPSNTKVKIDTVQVGNYSVEIKERNEIQIKEQNEIINERMKSFNDRIGDLYLSFTVIIVLLLAIVAGVYFKTETEVAEHMHRNYGKYKDEIEKLYAEAQKIVNELKAKADLEETITPRKENEGQITD